MASNEHWTLLKRDKSWNLNEGILALDFSNTAEWHASADPVERLNAYEDLASWSWAAGILDEDETRQLLTEAQGRPAEAHKALRGAIRLREAIYQVFSAIAADRPSPLEAVETINSGLGHALSHARIVPSDEGISWGWSSEERQLDRMMWPILRSAADLLTSDELNRVGECADDRGCGFLFFDRSKNRSRRWCRMEDCGNRAKAKRHYRRKKSDS
jgi:predicted RNA-binding Zn ribbon-like protein